MRTVSGIAIAFVVGVSLLAAGPAPAAVPAAPTAPSGPTATTDPSTAAPSRCWTRNRRCFGAVTVNMVSGKAFWTYKAMTKRAAVRGTMRRCRTAAQPAGCKQAGWVSNGCIAVYYRQVDGIARDWASGIRYSEVGARKRARNRLLGPGQRKAWSWPCTARSQRYPTRGVQRFGQW